MFSVIYKLEFYIRLCYKIFSIRNVHHVNARIRLRYVFAMHVGQLFKAQAKSVQCPLYCVFRKGRANDTRTQAAYASVYVSVT